MVTKHSGVKHKCAYCDYTHYYPSKIKTHESHVHKKIARISGKKNMVCNDKQCPHFFTKECKEIENHGRHVCTKCEYTTKRTADLKVHIQSVHEGVVFSCEECHYSDSNKRRLTKHIRSVHEGVIFSCDECQFSSKEKRRLNQHIQAVHEGALLRCKICNASVKYLKSHIFAQHKQQTVFSCEQCKFSTKRKSNLRRHLRTHSGEKSNKCDQCDFASSEASDLRRHLKTHSGKKSNKCNQCMFASSYASVLRTHLMEKSTTNATTVALYLLMQAL